MAALPDEGNSSAGMAGPALGGCGGIQERPMQRLKEEASIRPAMALLSPLASALVTNFRSTYPPVPSSLITFLGDYFLGFFLSSDSNSHW